jgi:transmembrane sensor
MTPTNRLWLLLSRRLSDEISSEEMAELQELVQQSPDKQYLLEILQAYFAAPFSDTTSADSGNLDLEQRFQRILHTGDDEWSSPLPPPVVRLSLRRILPYAAAAAAIFFLAWGIYFVRTHREPAEASPSLAGGEVIARPGARTRLVLPDSTQVWLNSNSKLKYASDFNTQSRDVELEGEAYFEVAKDPQRPFTVHAASINIRVLGTVFTVKSYAQDETIEATLLKGAIEISRRDNPNAPTVILKPNEKFILNKHLPVLAAHPADIIPPHPAAATIPDISVNAISGNVPDSDKVETAWLYNKLVFNGDSFKELAEKMERWYNVKIKFANESLYKYHFGGAFAGETIDDALKALQLTANFTYKTNGNEIVLYEK